MALQRIYEWRLIREGRPDVTTRSTRQAGMFKRYAARIGGKVERRQVGFRLPLRLTQLLDEGLNADR